MVETFFYDANGHDEQITLDQQVLDGVKKQQLIWIDAERADRDGLTQTAEILGLEQDTLSALNESKPPSQIVLYPDYFWFSLPLPILTGPPNPRLDFVVAPTWLLTVRDTEIDYLSQFREQNRGESYNGKLTPAALTASLLDRHLDRYQAEIAKLQQATDKIDNDILSEGVPRPPLKALSALHHRNMRIRRLVAEHRPIIHGLLRPDFDPLAGTTDAEFFRAMENHFLRTEEMVDHTREMVVGSFELYATRTAQDTNQLLKALTVITVIIGLTGAIAGIFGMNFETPFTKTGVHGFYITICIMALTAGAIWIVAIWKNWLNRD